MIRSIVAGAVALALGLGLSLAMGCAGAGGPKWTKAGASDAQLNKDQDDCMSRATIGADPGAVDPQARATVQRDFNNCMQARGWKKVKPQ